MVCSDKRETSIQNANKSEGKVQTRPKESQLLQRYSSLDSFIQFRNEGAPLLLVYNGGNGGGIVRFNSVTARLARTSIWHWTEKLSVRLCVIQGHRLHVFIIKSSLSAVFQSMDFCAVHKVVSRRQRSWQSELLGNLSYSDLCTWFRSLQQMGWTLAEIVLIAENARVMKWMSSSPLFQQDGDNICRILSPRKCEFSVDWWNLSWVRCDVVFGIRWNTIRCTILLFYLF